MVVTVHGTVNATMAGMTVPLSAGAILQLPATVRTGADGAVELRQGPSTFAAAGNTELEIPQSAAQDGLVERIVQIRGNAFYSIGKRTGTRLRVEAPYLVAVIKGTQFNVAAQEDSTTIALFEGHLEVRASDDSDVVDLDAGEIAIRRRNDVSISVLRLNAARGDTRRNPELASRQQADSSNPGSSAIVARSDNTSVRSRVDAPTISVDSASSGAVTTPARAQVVDAVADTTTNVTAKAAIEVDARDSAPVAANVDVDAKVAGAGVDAGATTTVDVAGVSANAGASAAVDVPAGSVDVGVGAGAAVGGAASVDTSVSAGADLSAGTVAASGDVGVTAGPVSAAVGTSAAVDAPAGTVDVGVSGAVAATNAVTIDTSVAAAANVPAGTVNVGADTSVAAAGLPVETSAAAAVDVPAGTVNVGTDVGVAGVNVGVDAGTSGVSLDVGTSNDSGGLLGGVGGLLGGRKRN
ncbi:MAG TPA: FecR domain-containing protein [Steroidobacteraceae bacterium]|nr:FecR domain-containing protein [Steroidobacteraceae bacterium]